MTVPYNSLYSSADSGVGLTVSNCNNIAFNGIDGCNITDIDSGCNTDI